MSFLTPLLCFSTLFLSVSADIRPFLRDDGYQKGEFGNYPRQYFVSDPSIVAPIPNVIVEPQEGVSPNEYITWAPTGPGVPLHGPQLLDPKTLSVVYQAPLLGPDNFGLSVQTCNNSDYLVWWTGTSIAGRAAGPHRIFNSNYESVWNVTAHGLKYADAHDLFLTPQCTAVITVMEPREYDLTEFGIETGWIMESYIQEIDLVTGELLFQWQASDHVDIKDTFWTLDITGDRGDSGSKITQSWDFFHINSVEKDWRGNYLISSRHLHSLLYVDGKTGMIHWTLGGRQNQFNDLSGGKATDIAWQHHARWANAELTAISVFDDRNCRYIKSSDPVSRGVVIGLDYMTMTANVEADFHATSNIQSFRKGGMHYLENGNAVLGYGNEPGFTEFAHNGTVLWDVRFGPILKDRDTADNYRSLKVNWTGNPTWSPKIAAGIPLDFKDKIHKVHIDPDTTKDTAYFSWNGATKVAKWAVLASNDSPRLMSMAHMWCEVAKAGFETSVFVGNEARYIRAVAISGSDEVLGATPVLDMQDGSLKEEDWSALDFNAGWKQRQDGEYDAERDWLAEFKVMKDDWKRMKAATQRTIVATICGGLFAVSLVIGVLSWRFRDEWVGFFTKRVQRGKYQATADDDDNMSLGSSEAYDLDLNTGEFGMQQNPDCEALLSRNWKQDESPS